MSNYYYTCYDKENEERIKQKKAESELKTLTQRPIKWDIFPTIVVSDTDKTIEDRLYKMRHMYSSQTAPLHQGEYVYNGYDKVEVYSTLYRKIFRLNEQVWNVPPYELATAYLELWEEFETFETWKPLTEQWHMSLMPDAKKMRLAARKCGLTFLSQLDIANKNGLSSATRTYTTGCCIFGDKKGLSEFTKKVKEEVKRGDNAFSGEAYNMVDERATLPCAYTILNIFVGMYREIYRKCHMNDDIIPPTYIDKLNGFEEYSYRKTGGENWEYGAILFAISFIFIPICLPIAIIGIVIGAFNMILGFESQL